MNNGQITDTVLNWAEQALGDVGQAGFAIVMFVLFLPLSFLIPSSSGLATVAMPIMSPLASFADVPGGAGRHGVPERLRDHEPLHPDLGRRDGRLAIARVPVRHLPEWVWPLLAMLVVLSVVALGVGALAS